GKSRLAVEVAERLAPAFADNVWQVDLAALGSPVPIGDNLSARVRVPAGPSGGHGDAAAIRALMILDNCEHLSAAIVPVVERLLHAHPGLHVIATSREVLKVPGAVSWKV